jgi:type I restriction enzyme, S subunit
MKAGWQTKTLGDACQIARGGSPRPIQDFMTDDPDGVNWIKISDATASGKFIYVTKEKIKPSGVARSRLVKPGDFLLSNSMSFGRPYIMQTTGCIHDGWLVLSDYEKCFDQSFLYHLLGSPVVFEQFDRLAAGSTVRNLNIELASRVVLPVPPLPEQQRIVTLLDEAFDGIATAKANAERNLQNARAIFESHLQSVFTRSGEGWTKTTLGKATGGVFTGPFGSLLHKSDYVENGIPLVNPAHITDVGIEPDLRKTVSEATAQKLSSYIMRKGDVVIGRRGEMGRCALVTDVEDGWLCGTGSFYIKQSPRCDSGYLVRYLRSDACKQRLEKIAGGAVMPNLSNTDLSNLSFDLPSIEMQKAIGDQIDDFATETQRLAFIYQQKLTTFDELKKSLLHRAFNGDL